MLYTCSFMCSEVSKRSIQITQDLAEKSIWAISLLFHFLLPNHTGGSSPYMSQLPVSVRDQLCAEVHQQYLAHNNRQKQQLPTPFQSNNAIPPAIKPTRLPLVEGENETGVGGRSEKGKKSSKPDFSILRFRFSENPYTFRSNKETVGGDQISTTTHHSQLITNRHPQPCPPCDLNPSFRSRRLQMIKKKNRLSDNDLVKKWNWHPLTYPSGKSQQNYGTNEVLSVAIRNFGRGTKVSRKKNRAKCERVPVFLPPLVGPREAKNFETSFKPIKVKDDQVSIARERRDFHGHGLYKNPQPFDHRGVSIMRN